MSWILAAVLLMATPALSTIRRPHGNANVLQVPEEQHFERHFVIRRPTIYLDCPPRAVCGVAFDFNRLINRRRLPERRIILNCMCPNTGEECPIVPEHRVYSSIRRREYLCQPVSSLPQCATGRPAKELVEGSSSYDYFNYFRVNCLCPRHIQPRMPKRRRGMALATSISRRRHDMGRHMIFHERVCVMD